MTKKEIAKAIAEQSGLSVLETQEVVQKTMNAIIAALLVDRRIELRGFGVFEVRKRAARNARNPRTGEKILVPETLVVTFKPGNEMVERLRGLATEPGGTSEAA